MRTLRELRRYGGPFLYEGRERSRLRDWSQEICNTSFVQDSAVIAHSDANSHSAVLYTLHVLPHSCLTQRRDNASLNRRHGVSFPQSDLGFVMNRSVFSKGLLFLVCLGCPISALAAPTVVFSPTSLDFGSHEVNTTTLPVAITMTNQGNAALNISKIVAGGSFAKFTSCGATLAPHASCTISV